MAQEPFTVPDEHMAWVGRVADAWAHLEFHIDLGSWTLAQGEQQLMACMTSQITSPHGKLKAFIALAQLNGASDRIISELNSFVGSVGRLADRRNRYVHDPRYVRNTTGVVSRLEVTAKPKVHFGFIPEEVDTLKKVQQDISDAINEFVRLRKKVISTINALPLGSQPQLSQIISLPLAPELPTSDAEEHSSTPTTTQE